jgi:molecular chaperone GrpE (heat shock protein)
VQVVAVIVALALLAVVLFVISGPLRAGAGRPRGEPTESSSRQRTELQAAREAKYREIRDADMDLRTGKLSRADHESIDRMLRAEALEILDSLQALERALASEANEDQQGQANDGQQGER